MNVLKEIIIEDHSHEWGDEFLRLKTIYSKTLGDQVVSIEHVGSTSVPDLAAKPVIDIDIRISDRNILPLIVAKLETLGYEHVGDWGIADREAFKRRSNLVPYTYSQYEWMRHNLYVCIAGSVALRNHLALRDYLRANPEKAQQYGELKKKLAAENPYDMDSNVKYKTPFIVEILEGLGFDQGEIEGIRRDNGMDC
jgi:GrpB-like predicted nucleotidyltransferase (UPF0157 family)